MICSKQMEFTFFSKGLKKKNLSNIMVEHRALKPPPYEALSRRGCRVPDTLVGHLGASEGPCSDVGT